MKTFINANTFNNENTLALTILEQKESGGVIELTDLTKAISPLITKYHNQLCEPDARWATREDIELLSKLLRLLANGIDQIEEIKKQ